MRPTNRQRILMENERRLADLDAILRDYFQNDQEGWSRGWVAWRDRAAKAVGLPTSEELRTTSGS